jgi:hypothetical protein
MCERAQTGDALALNVTAPNGAVAGIELDGANERLRSEDYLNLVLVNGALGQEREIPLE